MTKTRDVTWACTERVLAELKNKRSWYGDFSRSRSVLRCPVHLAIRLGSDMRINGRTVGTACGLRTTDRPTILVPRTLLVTYVSCSACCDWIASHASKRFALVMYHFNSFLDPPTEVVRYVGTTEERQIYFNAIEVVEAS